MPKVPVPKSAPPPKVKAPKEKVDEWVSRMAKKYSEIDLEKLEKKYPKAVRAVRLSQLQQRHMAPDQFAVAMNKLRKTKSPKEAVAM